MNDKFMMHKLLLFGTLILLSLNSWALDQVQDQQLSQQMTEIQNTLENSVVPELSRQSQTMRSVNSSVQRGLSGTTGVGTLNNTAVQRNFRDWTPSSADLANMVQQGLQTGSLKDQMKYYNEKFPVPTSQTLDATNPNNPLAHYGVFSATSTNAALSIADKGFDNVPEIIKQINFLYQQIDQQQTLKQGVDLNSVILLKIATLQTDLIRLQAQQLKMLGVSQEENNIKRILAAQFIKDVGEAP